MNVGFRGKSKALYEKPYMKSKALYEMVMVN